MIPFLMTGLALFGQADRPLPAEAAAKNLVVPKGMKATLFASEPMVSQPMALTTDSRGRVWVVENFSYPKWITDGSKGKDRVIILEDTDGDSKADKRTVFAEGLSFPNGVMPWQGGLIVTCAPDILFFKDTKGTGHADDERADGEGAELGVHRADADHGRGHVHVANRHPFTPDGAAHQVLGEHTKDHKKAQAKQILLVSLLLKHWQQAFRGSGIF